MCDKNIELELFDKISQFTFLSVIVTELGQRRNLVRNPERKCDISWLVWSSYNMAERWRNILQAEFLSGRSTEPTFLDSAYLIWQLQYCLKKVYTLNKIYVILQFALVLD
jgi:hypothetical protein